MQPHEEMNMRTVIVATLFAALLGCSKPTPEPVATTSGAPRAGQKLYLDIHHFGPGKVTAEDVAKAHQKDLATQGKYDVRYLSYWVDVKNGTVTCLAEAPNAEAAIAVHREAHGLLADAINEVAEGR